MKGTSPELLCRHATDLSWESRAADNETGNSGATTTEAATTIAATRASSCCYHHNDDVAAQGQRRKGIASTYLLGGSPAAVFRAFSTHVTFNAIRQTMLELVWG